MAMDGNGRQDSHSMAMDLTAMDGEGLLDSDLMGMDDEEQRECDEMDRERNGDGRR